MVTSLTCHRTCHPTCHQSKANVKAGFMCIGDKVTSYLWCFTCEEEQILGFFSEKHMFPTVATKTLVTLSPCHRMGVAHAGA